MTREILEPLAFFLTPFALYVVYLGLRARWPLEVDHWTSARVSMLTLAGLAAAVLGLVAVAMFSPRGQGAYIPAHLEKGVLVPGRFE